MFNVREKPQKVERALLIHVFFSPEEEAEGRALLEELAELVKTLDIEVIDSVLVRSREKKARTLMTSGKAIELMEHAEELRCDVIIFDNQLTPAQQRAWEQDANLTVIDREEVILDIFAQRARTKEARLQVELARMEYSLPRLARMWAHLDREGGGGAAGSGAAARGMGEQQIEIDRRIARERIDRAKRELAKIRAQRSTQRKDRLTTPVPHAAIVGYTNAGKSTLLNQLSGAEVYQADQLFATLDTTTRRIQLPDGQALLLTDTVGFVRNLPHRLVESFKATLEEVVLADFLIHVLDASSLEVVAHEQTTREVMEELGAGDKPVVLVFNKQDQISLEQKQKLSAQYPQAIWISAKQGLGMEDLVAGFNRQLLHRVRRVKVRIPQARGDLLHLLHRDGKVISTEYQGQNVVLEAVVSAALEGKLAEFQLEKTPEQREPWQQ